MTRFELLVVEAIFMRFQQLFIGVKIAVVQLFGRTSVYMPFGVSENLTVKTELPAGGADERRNSSEYQLNSVAWSIRSGEKKKTSFDDHSMQYLD